MDFLTLDSLPEALRIQATRRELMVDQWLFRPHNLARSLFIVESGRLQLTRSTLGSKLSVVQAIGPGEVFGEEALFAERYSGGAIAKMPSLVLVYPKEAVISALHNYADLSEDLVMLLARKIQPLAGSLELRQVKVAHQRLLRYLHRLATAVDTKIYYENSNEKNSNETIIQLDRPLKEVAAEIGFTAETLSRALVKLEQEGRITRSDGNIILRDLSAA
ncbi:MAG: Crp/Fnr family transcriptional regulator [Cyanobacteria bacterium P01_D01_bin.44]